MRRGSWRSICLAVALLGLVAGQASAAETCAELQARCASLNDHDLYTAAYLGTAGGPTNLGACYVHDRLTCPSCACHNYVKLSYLPDPKGYDGGTGCIQPMDDFHLSFLNAAATLRQLCAQGSCCCPTPKPSACPTQNPVAAKDSITGMCCTFANPCSVPSGWQPQLLGC